VYDFLISEVVRSDTAFEIHRAFVFSKADEQFLKESSQQLPNVLTNPPVRTLSSLVTP
jgi:hypothetical protein